MSYYECILVGTRAHWISGEWSSIPTMTAVSQFIEQDPRLLDSSASTQEYSVHSLTSSESTAVKLEQIFIKKGLFHSIHFIIDWTEGFVRINRISFTESCKSNEKATEKA